MRMLGILKKKSWFPQISEKKYSWPPKLFVNNSWWKYEINSTLTWEYILLSYIAIDNAWTFFEIFRKIISGKIENLQFFPRRFQISMTWVESYQTQTGVLRPPHVLNINIAWGKILYDKHHILHFFVLHIFLLGRQTQREIRGVTHPQLKQKSSCLVYRFANAVWYCRLCVVVSVCEN